MKIELNTNKVMIGLGKAGEIEVDVAKLAASEAVVNYVFNYGLKQMLNDVHASEKDLDAKVGLSQKKLDSLYRGEVAQARIGGGGDPVAKEMRRMVEQEIKDTIKRAGKKLSDFSKEALQTAMAKLLEKNKDEYRKLAEEKLAIQPKKTLSSDDIMGLFD